MRTVTYHQAHLKVTAVRGRASGHVCGCGRPAKDWAYGHPEGKTPRRTESGVPYSEDPDDYVAMCRGCHQKADNARGAFRGWKTLWDNPTEEYLERHRAATARTNSIRRRCEECGLESHPGGIGRHQQISGHRGFTEVTA